MPLPVASKYRNSVFSAGKRETWLSFDAPGTVHVAGTEPCSIKANSTLVAFRSGSTGASVGIVPHSQSGRIDSVLQLHNGCSVTDLDWAPWLDTAGAASGEDTKASLLAVGGDDGAVKVWRVVQTGLGRAAPGSVLATLAGGSASKRIEGLQFHPSAAGLLSFATGEEVQVWDIQTQKMVVAAADTSVVQSISWKADGGSVAWLNRDGRIRTADPRISSSKSPSADAPQAHAGTKIARVAWLGETDLILTTGSGTRLEREMALWDVRALNRPLVHSKIDSTPGSLMPLVDDDTRIGILASKGDAAIRWIEIRSDTIDSTGTSFRGSVAFAGACLVPKLGLDVMECEVARILGVTADGSAITPISVVVPRRSHADFHADIFPDTYGEDPASSADEWLSGATKTRKRVSLDPSKRAKASKPTAQQSTPPQSNQKESQAKQTSHAPAQPSSTPAVQLNLPKHSPFRFVTGKSSADFEDLKGLGTSLPAETDAFQANAKFFAIPIDGPGGRVDVWPSSRKGRLPARLPCVLAGTNVLDFKFDSFDDGRIALACEDGRVRLYKIPNTGLDADTSDESMVLNAHDARVLFVHFHPTAKDVLLTHSPGISSPTIKIWNLQTSAPITSINLPTALFCAAFSLDGEKIATIGRDKLIRVHSSRSGSVLQEGPSHEGTKAARVFWLGDTHGIVSVGFGKGNAREILKYSEDNLKEPKGSLTIDTAPGLLVAYLDEDTKLLLVGGKGESNISFYDVGENAPTLVAKYVAAGGVQQVSFAILPKRLCNVKTVEILKGYRLTASMVESVSFTVPRQRTEFFQDDIFILTRDVEQAVVSASEWASGKIATPKRINLCPPDMKPVSSVQVENKPERKTNTFTKEVTEAERREATMKAMFELAIEESKDGALPQDNIEGVADDEWD